MVNKIPQFQSIGNKTSNTEPNRLTGPDTQYVSWPFKIV